MKRPQCEEHSDKRSEYNGPYNCYFCEPCNRWLEKKCNDAGCYFCPKRPETPKESS